MEIGVSIEQIWCAGHTTVFTVMPWVQLSGTSTPIVINKYQLGICSEPSVYMVW